MPTFTFEGFTEGSLVALSAAQGAQGASGSVPQWRLSNMNTASIDILTIAPVEAVAPVGIWFEATNLDGFKVSEPTGGERYDPTAHDITYIWDFDDPGQFGAHLNVPTAWNNSNIDYGKKVYHVFDAPGTYAVRLWAIDREGVIGERLISVTVADPDVVHSGTRTICVSQAGDFTGAPPGSNNVTSIAAAQSAFNALGQSGRVLLRRGETFTDEFVIGGSNSIHIGAFGPPGDARPVMMPAVPAAGASGSGNCIAFQGGNTVPYACFHDISFKGDWDSTTETGDGTGKPFYFFGSFILEGHQYTIYRCDIHGFATMEPGNLDVGYLCGIVDCDIGDFLAYGVYVIARRSNGANAKIAIVGCNIAAAADACEGGYGREGLSNEQGPVRFELPHNVVISASYFYSASSWAGSVQPCLRFQEDVVPVPESRTYFNNVNRVVCEGGDQLFGADGALSGGSPYRPEIPGNYIFDTLLLVGGYTTSEWISMSYGGATIRNVYAILPNMNRTNGSALAFVDFNEIDPSFTGADNSTFPMRMYNCTFLNQSSIVFPQNIGQGSFSDIVIGNNIHHAPAAGVTTYAPVDLTGTIPGFVSRQKGRRRGPTIQTTSVSSVGIGQTFTIGYPQDGFGNTLGPSDFVAAGRHTIKIGGARWYSHRGHFTVALGASNITVTNTSGATMNGAVQMKMERSNLTTDATYATPAVLPLLVPVSGSPALDATGGARAHTQFDTAERQRPKGAV